jgi:hypothetical protein
MEGEESLAEHYRKRAAKARRIISQPAADPALLEHLERVAREYDALADRFEAESSGKPKTD